MASLENGAQKGSNLNCTSPNCCTRATTLAGPARCSPRKKARRPRGPGWSAKDRSDKFRKLCVDNEGKHPDGLPDADALVRWLDEAFPLCRDRNLLVHGVWWAFDVNAHTLEVHTMRTRNNGPLGRAFTVEQIRQLAELFKDVEVELWKLQSAIEARLPSEPLQPELCEPE